MNNKLVMATAAVFGLALLGTIPALAQAEEPATQPSAVCPYHDQDNMTYEDMNRWMDPAAHHEWMDSAAHDRMHAAMGDMDPMMDGSGAGPGNMMGGTMGTGNMMGRSK